MNMVRDKQIEVESNKMQVLITSAKMSTDCSVEQFRPNAGD